MTAPRRHVTPRPAWLPGKLVDVSSLAWPPRKHADMADTPSLSLSLPADQHSDFQELEDAEDLFPELAGPREADPARLDISTKSNGPKQDSFFEDDADDLFAEATEEVSLDSPEREVLLSDGPSPAITPITPPCSVITPLIGHAHDDMFTHSSFDEQVEVEGGGEVHISVSDPEKVGDGMNAYMAYKVTTKTSSSLFRLGEFSVRRRFSDFLGLHSKLASKYLHVGCIVPPAPEKSIVGMTKVKVGKEDQSSNDFVEKRRLALERYLMRTAQHPVLLKDPDLLQFLESCELPRAVSTQALSGAGLLRMVNKAADAVNKMTIKMNESDAWFEEKQQHFENLDVQLRKLHASVESLVCHRKELSLNTAQFAKSTAMLGNSEDHTALSRALSQLAEVEEKMEQQHHQQAHADFYFLSELLGDYVRLLAAVKGVFEQRVKTWQRWQDNQVLLQKKREAQVKLHFSNKVQQAKDDIKELEVKVQQGERDFEKISGSIRREVGRFEFLVTTVCAEGTCQRLQEVLHQVLGGPREYTTTGHQILGGLLTRSQGHLLNTATHNAPGHFSTSCRPLLPAHKMAAL
ncbi:sorting nexin-2-like isoform X3 [Entelurus aequoreus]|uniref:sorting nexin-2-like isoform X3 n=1 Tax=Entelurus aequoreus TaxID=161455 RepID=UPI002B1E3A66|nr:sorting nexin-2-like isoform X3 [Entelurus aequoreus]